MILKTEREVKEGSFLYWFFRLLLFVVFLILFGRLTELQVIKGSYFRELAEENRVKKITLAAPRGRIYSQDGVLLVGNKEVKKKIVINEQGQVVKSADIKGALPESLTTEYEREYLFGPSLAHISGYVGEVNKEEVGRVDPDCSQRGPYKLGSLKGRGGLEETYECQLSGLDGEELLEVDAQGKEVRILGRKEPLPGQDLVTNLFAPLQRQVTTVLEEAKEAKIAALVTDSQGRVLALYSKPSFDPNLFVAKDKSGVTGILEDHDLPLFNRVISGAYHPGSVFKPLVAVAALEEKLIDESFTFEDRGEIVIDTIYGKFSYKNWYFIQYGKTEGVIGLVKAIARSTDTFFYKLGDLLGVNALVDWAKQFGLGSALGIDLPGEVGGLVPSPNWKEAVKGEAWFLGNTYHLAIGQGDLALTPLSVNAVTAAVSRGQLCTPRVVGEPKCQDLGLKKETIKLVKEGMQAACRQGGTGFTFFDFEEKYNTSVACKTGTAETAAEDPHAWFNLFSPVDEPKIVVTVLVEEGGEGSSVAGPLARKIMDYWQTR